MRADESCSAGDKCFVKFKGHSLGLLGFVGLFGFVGFFGFLGLLGFVGLFGFIGFVGFVELIAAGFVHTLFVA